MTYRYTTDVPDHVHQRTKVARDHADNAAKKNKDNYQRARSIMLDMLARVNTSVILPNSFPTVVEFQADAIARNLFTVAWEGSNATERRMIMKRFPVAVKRVGLSL